MKLHLYAFVILVAVKNSWAEEKELYPNLTCLQEFDKTVGKKNIIHFLNFCETNKGKFACFKVCIMHLAGIIRTASGGKGWKQQKQKVVAKAFERFFFLDTDEGVAMASDLAKKMTDKCSSLISDVNKVHKKEPEKGKECDTKEWTDYLGCIDKIWNCNK